MSPFGMVITIDGPAGAGKSTVAKLLAQKLGFQFLDTGAMYRCVTLAALRQGTSLANDEVIARIASTIEITFDGDSTFMNQEDVSKDIRSPEVASAIGRVADNVAVRQRLSDLQRKCAFGKCIVTEGRDQGTSVFPDSRCKIFLSATEEERARRRQRELRQRGRELDYDTVLEQQKQRDHEDRTRPVGALCQADDAVAICTTGKTLANVVDELEVLVRSKLGQDIDACSSDASSPDTKPQSKQTTT